MKKAWKAANAEGLKFYRAHMHVGHTVQFVGDSWEYGGFSVDDDGNPGSDVKGNSVAKFEVEELDDANADHRIKVDEWYG